MSNMFDYLKWRGDISFNQVPLNKIDALIFAQLSYTNMEGLVSSDFSQPITLEELSKIYSESPDYESKRNTSYYKKKRTSELLVATGNSRRFSQVKVCGFKQIIDEKKQEQFAAMVFLLENTAVIAFVGTDDTLVGWKEDFILSFSPHIPSHQDGLDYFEKVASYFKQDLVIVGHSKGGNIAINTAVNCSKENQDRITNVYNFDGPGFDEAFFKKKGFKNIEDRLVSVYPAYSIVGMIFHHQKNFEIVKSAGVALNQHKAHLWEICGADFVHEVDFTTQSKIFHESLNDWAEQVPPHQREILSKNLFEILDASGAKTVTELSHIRIKSLQKMISTYSKLKDTQSDDLRKFVKLMVEVAQDTSPIINTLKKGAFIKE